MEQKGKQCQNCKEEFTIEPEDFAFYEKVNVPAPTFCYLCRLQRRLSFHNRRNLYKRTCDATGEPVVSIFSPNKDITVYHNKEWWSDSWDGRDYGVDYDPDQSFFEQFKQLQRTTPWISLVTDPTNVRSDYTNYTGNLKDCYLCFSGTEGENLLYCSVFLKSRDSMDSLMMNNIEMSYQVVDGNGSYMYYCEGCNDSMNLYFCKECNGCQDCFGCMNLRNKQYCWFNEQLTKEEYEKRLENTQLDSYKAVEEYLQQAREFWTQFPVKYYHGRQNNNVSGDHIYYSHNYHYGYQSVYAEDCKYCQFLSYPSTKDCYDVSEWGQNLELSYDTMTAGDNAQKVKFCWSSWGGAYNTEYCMMTPGSENCFGCCNLKKGKFCILNKQYTEQEYNDLREKIIEDMNTDPYVDEQGREWRYGEFFPYELSMFGYNESLAADYFPFSKAEAKENGFNWSDDTGNAYEVRLSGDEIPDSIHDVDESILKEVLGCVSCDKAYRIVAGELKLLKKFGLPIPRKCPYCRHTERLSRLNPPKLWKRTTDDGVEVWTPYSPENNQRILSEEGYKREVL